MLTKLHIQCDDCSLLVFAEDLLLLCLYLSVVFVVVVIDDCEYCDDVPMG